MKQGRERYRHRMISRADAPQVDSAIANRWRGHGTG